MFLFCSKKAKESRVAVAEAERVAAESPGVAAAVRAILSVPDAELAYGKAKLALDHLVDPGFDPGEVMAELDAMAARALEMAGPEADESTKLGAIRHLIYESGPWNDHRPFAYDPSDPLGQRLDNKLLPNYLATRRGQCVSMPILFLVLAEKLGIDMRLACAPHHVFLRYTDQGDRTFNVEATSGGHPARDEWYRSQFAISDRAIESGVYMRTLSRRESVALMATTVLQHLMFEARYAEAIAASEVILRYNPRDVHVLLWKATACGELVQREFAAKYPIPFLIPEPARSRYRFLTAMNEALLARAEALGWEPDPEWEPPRIAAYPAPEEVPRGR